jgi:hypothetical protein
MNMNKAVHNDQGDRKAICPCILSHLLSAHMPLYSDSSLFHYPWAIFNRTKIKHAYKLGNYFSEVQT